jgi:hypothetical protein
MDIGPCFGVLINMTTDDDDLVVRTLCDRGPIPFKCMIKPRIPNARRRCLRCFKTGRGVRGLRVSTRTGLLWECQDKRKTSDASMMRLERQN